MITLSLIETTLAMAVRMSTPYLFAALGGMLSQRAGVYNFSLEGNMLGGAFFGYFVALMTGNLALGLVAAMLYGIFYGWLLAFICIRFGVSQMIVGIALNTLALGITSFCSRVVGEVIPADSLNLDHLMGNLFGDTLAGIPILGSLLLGQNIMTYMIVALFILYAWFIKRTDSGLALRAVGENPAAAQAAGINVFRYRYTAVILSGVFASLGGSYLTLTQVNRFAEEMTNGRGWIAIAAISLGRLTPLGTFLSCLLFGLAAALSNQIQVLDLGVPYQIALMMPYILAILALISVRGKRSGAPAALGKAYFKQR